MATPPTLVAAYSANATTSPVTTSSLTLQAGDIVTVLAVNEGAQAGDTINAPTTTFANGGITQLQLHAAASDCPVGAWTFTVSTGASGTVSVTVTNATAKNTRIGVFAHRSGVAPVVARSTLGTGSSRTANYTASQVDSAIVWAVGDWAAAAVQTPTPTSTTHAAGSPGPTAMPASSQVTSIYTGYVAVLDDQTTTAATAYGVGGTGTGPFSIVVVEIQGAGAVAAIPPELTMAPRRF